VDVSCCRLSTGRVQGVSQQDAARSTGLIQDLSLHSLGWALLLAGRERGIWWADIWRNGQRRIEYCTSPTASGVKGLGSSSTGIIAILTDELNPFSRWKWKVRSIRFHEVFVEEGHPCFEWRLPRATAHPCASLNPNSGPQPYLLGLAHCCVSPSSTTTLLAHCNQHLKLGDQPFLKFQSVIAHTSLYCA
jgi:hypothetical protein